MSKINTHLITVSGPSLTGKSKMAQLLNPFGYEELVSTTTRAQRAGEINGVHYFFVTVSDFKKMIEKNELIEYNKYGENFYGTSQGAFDSVINKGKFGVSVVEPEGAMNIRKYCLDKSINLHQIFLNNDTNLLLERLFERFRNDSLASNKDYAKRAYDMLHKEKELWIQPALDGRHPYHQVFDSFLQENEQEVVNKILNYVELKFKKNNLKPR